MSSPKKVSALTESKVVTPNNFLGLKTPNFFNTSAAIGTVELTGLEMIKSEASGHTLPTLATKSLTIEALILNKSALVIPGFLGTPAGMTTNDELANAALMAEVSDLSLGWWPVTLAPELIWDKSAATP